MAQLEYNVLAITYVRERERERRRRRQRQREQHQRSQHLLCVYSVALCCVVCRGGVPSVEWHTSDRRRSRSRSRSR